MRIRTCFLILCCNLFEKSKVNIIDGYNGIESNNLMIPGYRVSAIDRASAKCSANPDHDRELSIQRTVVNYYYAIESTEKITTDDSAGRSIIRMLEDKLFRTIRPAILWCYFDEIPSTRRNLQSYATSSLQDSEKLKIFRKLSFEEARRLSIVSFSTSPEDQETPINCNFQRQDDMHCIVIQGRVTIMHHETSDVSIAVASIYDSTQKAMDYSEIFFDLQDDKNMGTITNIEWLGETEQDAINGGPRNGELFVGGPNGLTEEVSKNNENERSMLAYALSVPILILIALALLLTRSKEKRKVKTRKKIAMERSFENVLIGTGDPCSNGVLSTNETKKLGFYNAGALDTITERSIEEDYDPTAHPNKQFIPPSSNALGVKHSSMDVHYCRSARCPICAHDNRDVNFIAKDDFITLRSGESEV
mmetsp:Transcript_8734/g.21312  ORF Transcript_8734/g.21312 Transcript_8734/m.21312 type:complete len:420 (-) Transcript_8734:114-1373(-)|eukprot:CAMPEP_0197191098 /NCGR_PEP_ID=MMETSP1423-20130617/22764_1 /TAXON_ID=476441 /ORGANISM="Pseudo-nitzschia heimii, Strain UNC1101" /LENGTH=419 /DNA_ID=CAMNT_0042643637 /DNA_START=70 /DNA_END=1329 /DNA_ORIENTATION=+